MKRVEPSSSSAGQGSKQGGDRAAAVGDSSLASPPRQQMKRRCDLEKMNKNINHLPQDVLCYTYQFLVGKLEDVALLAVVSKAFNACAKKLVLMGRLKLSTHARFGRMANKEEASSVLLEYLRLISAHYPGTTSIDLGTSNNSSVDYVKNEHVQMLANFRSLTTLSLKCCRNVTDVRPLSSLTLLQDLNLYSTKITAEGLLAISTKLTQLTKLNLDSCRSITGAGLACLSSLTSLQDLNLYNTKINDEGLLACLSSLPSLRVLA